MDEDEQEDLLVAVSDIDDSPEESDAYLDVSRKVNHGPPFRHGLGRCCLKKRVEFLSTGVLCLISATALLVLLPLYLETSTRVADVYPSILFCTATSSILTLALLCISAKFRVFSIPSFKENVIPPFTLWRIVQIGSMHSIGGLSILFALDRQRVLCHLQDPMKGLILVFSMVYYFCFSRKIMGLQKVFCATTIVIGLFVSVDYALCDEFHCRGYEREKVEDDSGHWNRATHFLWGVAYILGLGAWCFHFSLLEGQVVALHLDNQLVCTNQTSLLGTISCMVSSQNDPAYLEVQSDTNEQSLPNSEYQSGFRNGVISSSMRNGDHLNILSDDGFMANGGSPQGSLKARPPSAINVAFWVHTTSLMITILFFWTGMTPTIGKGSSWNEFLNNTHVGVLCHFQSFLVLNDSSFPGAQAAPQILCGSLPVYGWMFAAGFIIFSVSAYHFLILCQSSVFTVALITSALPLANIFWSLFRLAPINGGFIQWWPNFTPELVCTLLGIPIIVTGLVLLCKAHWTNTTQKELCCTLRYHPRPVHS